MRVLSLFSGGGLGDYGLTLAGMEIVAQVEIDDYCQKILKLRWPDVPKWKDIRDVTGKEIIERCGAVDLVSGGFPCQPFSAAGKRRGKQDDRYLWPEMFRVISEVKPSWVFSENVPDVIRFALDDMFSDLEGIGYSCEAFIIPACSVDAPHKRSRLWFLANSASERLERNVRSRQNVEGGVQDFVKLLPTPKEQNSRGSGERHGTGGISLDVAVGGKLNPIFVEWMMGLPIGWTDLNCSETAKFAKWLNGLGVGSLILTKEEWNEIKRENLQSLRENFNEEELAALEKAHSS